MLVFGAQLVTSILKCKLTILHAEHCLDLIKLYEAMHKVDRNKSVVVKKESN